IWYFIKNFFHTRYFFKFILRVICSIKLCCSTKIIIKFPLFCPLSIIVKLWIVFKYYKASIFYCIVNFCIGIKPDRVVSYSQPIYICFYSISNLMLSFLPSLITSQLILFFLFFFFCFSFFLLLFIFFIYIFFLFTLLLFLLFIYFY